MSIFDQDFGPLYPYDVQSESTGAAILVRFHQALHALNLDPGNVEEYLHPICEMIQRSSDAVEIVNDVVESLLKQASGCMYHCDCYVSDCHCCSCVSDYHCCFVYDCHSFFYLPETTICKFGTHLFWLKVVRKKKWIHHVPQNKASSLQRQMCSELI